MSVQIFLQGKILGIEEFLLSGPGLMHLNAAGDGISEELLVAGCSRWVVLLSEVLPRALLAELGLSKILLGASGGGQFLVVLPDEARGPADEFLNAAAAGISELSCGLLKLVWAVTENLGDWSIVRKRLNDAMQKKRGAPAAEAAADAFEPFEAPVPPADAAEYFGRALTLDLRDAQTIGWSPEAPARILAGEGKHVWPIGSSIDGILIARHIATGLDENKRASTSELAGRAEGRLAWGVLRGDVDNFGVRIRRAQTIEEHVQLSVMFKQFFAGELEVLCSMPEFWRKVTILYSGGDDFAVYGAWDALIQFAREMQRLFHRFSEENLKEFPGPEGKTISMALALAPENDAALAVICDRAGRRLEIAKSTNKDSFYLFGRTLEWRQLADAADLKDTMTRMVANFGCPPQFLSELASFYREAAGSRFTGQSADAERRSSKPWRFHRRLSRVMGVSRDREFQKLRTNLLNEFVSKGTAQLKLRPAGRVALEWARLSTEV